MRQTENATNFCHQLKHFYSSLPGHWDTEWLFCDVPPPRLPVEGAIQIPQLQLQFNAP